MKTACSLLAGLLTLSSVAYANQTYTPPRINVVAEYALKYDSATARYVHNNPRVVDAIAGHALDCLMRGEEPDDIAYASKTRPTIPPKVIQFIGRHNLDIGRFFLGVQNVFGRHE